jgi:hypothetical protein
MSYVSLILCGELEPFEIARFERVVKPSWKVIEIAYVTPGISIRKLSVRGGILTVEVHDWRTVGPPRLAVVLVHGVDKEVA